MEVEDHVTALLVPYHSLFKATFVSNFLFLGVSSTAEKPETDTAGGQV